VYGVQTKGLGRQQLTKKKGKCFVEIGGCEKKRKTIRKRSCPRCGIKELMRGGQSIRVEKGIGSQTHLWHKIASPRRGLFPSLGVMRNVAKCWLPCLSGMD